MPNLGNEEMMKGEQLEEDMIRKGEIAKQLDNLTQFFIGQVELLDKLQDRLTPIMAINSREKENPKSEKSPPLPIAPLADTIRDKVEQMKKHNDRIFQILGKIEL